jgi:hypothetical protein
MTERSAPPRRVAPATLLALLRVGCAGQPDAPRTTAPPVAASASVAAAGYEAPPVLRARDVLPPDQLSGAGFEVADEVRNDGLLNYYTVRVREPEASLEVAGTELLRVRLADLDAVARIREVKRGSTFAEGAKNAATGPLRFARDLVTAPGATLSSAAAGVGSRVGNVGHALSGSTGAGEEGALKTAIGFDAAKRAYAHRFGVGPYSTNPIVRDELDEIDWIGFAGGAVVGAGFGALPDAGAAAARGGGLGERLAGTLRDNAPAELAALNERRLRAMGVPGEAARTLLASRGYTPTDRARLVAALDRLDGVADRAALVEWAAAAQRPEVAFLMARHAEMLAAYHARVAPLARFARRGGRALPLRGDGVVVAAFPLDHVTWSERLEIAVRALDAPGAASAAGREFWITGRFSPLARSRLEVAGWTLHEEAGDRLRLD